MMTSHAGVYRNSEKLEKAKKMIAELKERYENIYVQDKGKVFNTDLLEAIEVGNLLELATAIVEGALARKECRGAHWRIDHPGRDDEKWMKHTVATKTDEGIKLHYSDISFTKYEPTERKY